MTTEKMAGGNGGVKVMPSVTLALFALIQQKKKNGNSVLLGYVKSARLHEKALWLSYVFCPILYDFWKNYAKLCTVQKTPGTSITNVSALHFWHP